MEKTRLTREEIDDIRAMKLDAYFTSKEAIRMGMAEMLEVKDT